LIDKRKKCFTTPIKAFANGLTVFGSVFPVASSFFTFIKSFNKNGIESKALTVFPNPNQGEFKVGVFGFSPDRLKMTLFDNTGRVIQETKEALTVSSAAVFAISVILKIRKKSRVVRPAFNGF